MLSKKTKNIVAVALLAAVSNSSIVSAEILNQNKILDIRNDSNTDAEYKDEDYGYEIDEEVYDLTNGIGNKTTSCAVEYASELNNTGTVVVEGFAECPDNYNKEDYKFLCDFLSQVNPETKKSNAEVLGIDKNNFEDIINLRGLNDNYNNKRVTWKVLEDSVNRISEIYIDGEHDEGLKGKKLYGKFEADNNQLTNLESLSIKNNYITKVNLNGSVNLKGLYFPNNIVNEVVLSSNVNLNELDFSHNKLKGINLDNNINLETIIGNNNELTGLNVSKNTQLKNLYIKFNKITDIKIDKNEALEQLICGNNELSSLNVENNINLKSLYINSNKIKEIEISANKALKEFGCWDNELSTLSVSDNTKLTYLNFTRNKIKTIDLSQNVKLESLICGFNQLSDLDLSKNKKLIRLNCSNNNLNNLDTSMLKELTILYCNGNNISDLNLKDNSNLSLIEYDKQYSFTRESGNIVNISYENDIVSELMSYKVYSDDYDCEYVYDVANEEQYKKLKSLRYDDSIAFVSWDNNIKIYVDGEEYKGQQINNFEDGYSVILKEIDSLDKNKDGIIDIKIKKYSGESSNDESSNGGSSNGGSSNGGSSNSGSSNSGSSNDESSNGGSGNNGSNNSGSNNGVSSSRRRKSKGKISSEAVNNEINFSGREVKNIETIKTANGANVTIITIINN